jgi:hypothetical protein
MAGERNVVDPHSGILLSCERKERWYMLQRESVTLSERGQAQKVTQRSVPWTEWRRLQSRQAV